MMTDDPGLGFDPEDPWGPLKSAPGNGVGAIVPRHVTEGLHEDDSKGKRPGAVPDDEREISKLDKERLLIALKELAHVYEMTWATLKGKGEHLSAQCCRREAFQLYDLHEALANGVVFVRLT